MSQQGQDELRGEWILGSEVQSSEGEDIGAIEDLIISDEGEINAAIVSVGGFLGFSAKNIAVDWSELQIEHDGTQIELALTRAEAEEAEDYVYRQRETPESAGGTGTGTGTDTGTGTGTGAGTGAGTGTATGTGTGGN